MISSSHPGTGRQSVVMSVNHACMKPQDRQNSALCTSLWQVLNPLQYIPEGFNRQCSSLTPEGRTGEGGRRGGGLISTEVCLSRQHEMKDRFLLEKSAKTSCRIFQYPGQVSP